MGWSTSAPSGVSWSSAVNTGTIKNNFYNYWGETSIARGKNNTVYIRVKLCAQLYSWDYRLTAPNPEMKARINGAGASSWTESSVYAASRPAFGATVTVKTVYWTGTAAPNATCAVQASNTSSNTGSATLSAPAYNSTYTVTLNRSGGSGGSASVTATYGSAMPSISVPTRTGYTFGGYFTGTNGSGTQYYTASGASAQTCTLSANITLYAKWTAKTYTATLNPEGGSGGTASVTATYGSAMPAITVPTRTGYTFGGYYTGTDGSGTQYYTATGTSANSWNTASAATLHAKWTANTYTVSFDSAGGSACESVSVTYGQTYGTLPTPERANYTFTGWFTAAEGGTQVSASTVVSITAEQTLHAHWTLNAVTITYYGNGSGATGIPAAQDKLIGDTATISTAVPARNGFTFLNWNTAPGGNGTDYSGGDSYSTDADLALYAQWAGIPEVSDITAVRCNSSGVTTNTDADTYAEIGFGWAADPALTGATYTIRWVNREDPTNTGSVSGSLSGTGGTVSGIICGAATGAVSAIETAYQYDVTITVTDSNGGHGAADDFVSRAYYVLDFTAGGMGVGIGAPARDGRITTGLPHTADAEERGTHYEQIRNVTDNTLLRSLDWDGNETLLGGLEAGGEIEDGSGNVLSEKADASDTYTKAETLALFLDRTYPVGAIYLSAGSTSPASLFGGTWERITGKFLLAATDNGSSGAAQAAGNTGGEATHKLTTGELPAHTHGSKSLTGAISFRKVGSSPSAIYGAVSGIFSQANNDTNKYEPLTQYDSTKRQSQKLTVDATHTHDSVGSGTAHSNMPPWLAVYVWQRIE